jgi:hypothetical protein
LLHNKIVDTVQLRIKNYLSDFKNLEYDLRSYKKVDILAKNENSLDLLIMLQSSLEDLTIAGNELIFHHSNNLTEFSNHVANFPRLKKLKFKNDPGKLEEWIVKCLSQSDAKLEEFVMIGFGRVLNNHKIILEILKFIFSQQSLKLLDTWDFVMDDLNGSQIKKIVDELGDDMNFPHLEFFGFSIPHTDRNGVEMFLSKMPNLKSLKISHVLRNEDLEFIINKMEKLEKLDIELVYLTQGEFNLNVNKTIQEISLRDEGIVVYNSYKQLMKQILENLPELKILNLEEGLDPRFMTFIAENLMKLEKLTYKEAKTGTRGCYERMKHSRDDINKNIQLIEIE